MNSEDQILSDWSDLWLIMSKGGIFSGICYNSPSQIAFPGSGVSLNEAQLN